MSDSRSIRLQKYIADCGITSRRKAEDLILEGKVKINGIIVTELGSKVNVDNDLVEVNNEVIHIDAIERLYIVFNKPRSVVTTVSDPEGRTTVMDFLDGLKTRVFPVGRLDYLSEGLLILTNDGELGNKIIHPRYEIVKTYEVKIFGLVNEGLLQKLRVGIKDRDGLLQPKSVRVIEQLPNKTWLEFKLAEGKNREIRRLCEACGLTIDKLRRVAIGGLSIEGIKPGDFDILSRKEILKSLGIKDDLEGKVTQITMDYKSPKKSLPFEKRVKYKSKVGKPADSKEFRRFKKERYFTTINREKFLKEQEDAEAAKNEIKPGAAVNSTRKPVPSRRVNTNRSEAYRPRR